MVFQKFVDLHYSWELTFLQNIPSYGHGDVFNFLSSLPLSLPELFTFEISDLGFPNFSMSLVSLSQKSNGRIASELVSLINKIHDWLRMRHLVS